MELTVNQRLKIYVESKKINPPDVYFKIGSSRTEWSGWVNSGKAISLLKLTRILEFFEDLNARWLITGQGSMYNGGDNQTMTQEPTSPYQKECTNPLCAERLRSLTETVNELKADKKFLQEQLQRKVEPPENKHAGGVDKAVRRTG